MDIDAALVRRLIAAQLPQWADLPVEPVVPGGRNNQTFRLGETMSVRLPAGAGYAPQVRKEQAWLPRLAADLPLPVPEPLALGAPGEGYPWPWSVNRWLPGEPASRVNIRDLTRFARDLADFLVALQAIDASGGPRAGQHNFFRGGYVGTYDADTRQALAALDGCIDARGAQAVWEAALTSPWRGPPVWVHGDVAPGNLLVDEGRLAAVIDFGILGVGDPASDLVIAWTFLDGDAREAFREAMALGEDYWLRGRAWALWKALIQLAGISSATAEELARARLVVDVVIAEHADSR